MYGLQVQPMPDREDYVSVHGSDDRNPRTRAPPHCGKLVTGEVLLGGEMKRFNLTALALLMGILLLSAPLFAHHGQAGVDLNRKVTLKGIVTSFEWVNPHAHFSFDVKDDSGKVQNWTMELTTPLMLQRIGWSRTILKPGDQVTATFYPAKNGSTIGILDTVLLSDGTVLGRGGSTHVGEQGVKQ
jgi:hypothetical protein